MFGYAWRSITAVMTAFYLLLSVGSCTVPPPEGSVYTPVYDVSLGASSVGILQSDPEIGRVLQPATEQFALSLGTSISFTVQTVAGDDYRAALHSRLLAGEEADLFLLGGRADVERLQPWLQDMSMLPWVGDAYDGALETVHVDGVVYGVPYNYEGIGLVVNRRIFEAAGIALGDIRDFEGLSEAFMGLRDAIDAGELSESFPELAAVTDIAVQNSSYLGTQVAELLLAGSYTSPARALDSAPTLSEAEGAEALLTLLARVSAQRTDWTTFAGVSEYRMLEGGLAAERVAAVLGSTDIYRRILEANPDMEGALGLLPLYLPEWETGAVFAGPASWWAIRAEAEEPVKELAGAFLTWLYQSEDGGQVLAEKMGALSAYSDTARTGIRLHQDLLSAQAGALTMPRLASAAPYGWGEEVFAPELQAYFTVYAKTWEELVENSRSGWAERLG